MNWGMFNIYPNLYIVLVGPSGCRKGTAMGPGYKMLSDLGIKMAAEAITREALIRELKKSSSTQVLGDGTSVYMHSSLTIFSQELTVFLGYNNLSLMSDLCDWFDCRERWVYRTKNMGEDDIIGVWVNLIGATTPDLLQTTLPRDAIGGGLTARMIIVFAPRKGKTVVAPFETQAERGLRDKLMQDLERISMLAGEFKITPAFTEAWAEWYTYQDDHPPFSDVRLGGYMERRPLHTLKLCMVVSASRSNNMVVDVEDLKRATSLLTEAEQGMLKAFSGIGKSKLSDVMSRVLSFIAVKKNTTFSEILANFYFDADIREMNTIIETMVASKAIKVVYKGNVQHIEFIKGGGMV